LDGNRVNPGGGSILVTPQSSKSLVFRVATAASRDRHTGAITASNCRDRPADGLPTGNNLGIFPCGFDIERKNPFPKLFSKKPRNGGAQPSSNPACRWPGVVRSGFPDVLANETVRLFVLIA
jgi:hypothetical protein